MAAALDAVITFLADIGAETGDENKRSSYQVTRGDEIPVADESPLDVHHKLHSDILQVL